MIHKPHKQKAPTVLRNKSRDKLILTGLWLCALLSALFFAIGLYLHLGTKTPPTPMQAAPKTSVHHQPKMSPKGEADQATVISRDKANPEPSKPRQSTSLQEAPTSKVANTPAYQAKVAIIIDDLGYQWSNGLESLQLEGEFTFAILPFSPFGTRLANKAFTMGKEVMLHAPMEPENHHAWDRGLETGMDHQQVRQMFMEMLSEIPHAKGLNNHMGSALTQDATIMGWVMDEVAHKQLYFVDSVTTSKSVAYSSALTRKIPSFKRDIFIDNIREPTAMEQQLNKLIRQAQKKGSAIGICHPYPETLAFLSQIGATLRREGIHLVPVSLLLSDSPFLAHRD